MSCKSGYVLEKRDAFLYCEVVTNLRFTMRNADWVVHHVKLRVM